MAETGYQPVPHDAAFRDALLAKPGVQKAFDALEEEYTTLHAMLDDRQRPQGGHGGAGRSPCEFRSD